MKISRIVTNGIRGLPDRGFDLADPASGQPHDLVLITGPTGSGKTSLLDAVAAAKDDVGPYGPAQRPHNILRRDVSAGKITASWFLGAEERKNLGFPDQAVQTESIFGGTSGFERRDPRIASALRHYRHDPGQGKFEYFHAERTLAPDVTGATDTSERAQGPLRLSKGIRKYAAIPRFLHEVCLGVDDRVDDPASWVAAYAGLFGSLCGSVRFVGITRIAGEKTVTFEAAGGALLTLDELSSAELDAVIFSATALMIGLSRSILLIDRPELHVGSAAVVPFVNALRGLGIDNQLLVATGSQELLQSVQPGTVIRLGKT
jgi:energy-coupling factor transporter ATP-binding protein EcfA2